MNSKNHLSKFIVLTTIVTLGFSAAQGEEEAATADTSAINPEAISILALAVKQLTDAKYFTVEAETWQDMLLEDGSRAQFTKLVNIALRRPDRLRVDVSTNVPKRSFYYDGKQLTVLGHKDGFFGTVKAPDTIDAMLDAVTKIAGVSFPLEDLLISKPFGDGAKSASAGEYFGIEPVLGVNCHHLAFQNETVDWQVWVEDGLLPLVRKVVITFKEEEGSPQFLSLFKNWDFSTPLGDHLFTFEPPAGAIKLEMIPEEEIPSSPAEDQEQPKAE